jgi:hypothetical protein
VGQTLRAGPVRTVELRASMIVGHGSLSWLIVRDLAARLPVMVLPQWLKSRTQPVAIGDVVIALVRAFAEAARIALETERRQQQVAGTWGAIEQARGLRERRL